MALKGKKIGLVGVGNMGSAILDGLLSRRLVASENLWVFDKDAAKSGRFAEEARVHAANSNTELVQKTDIVLLAVKPQDLTSVSPELKRALGPRHIVISILAGMSLDKLRQHLGESVLVRAMPNLGAKVGQSMTALASSSGAGLDCAEEIFSACGKTVRLDESHFDLITALSGSGPAYFFLLMELMAKKAMEKGLGRETAELLAAQTAVGAALVAQASAQSAAELRAMVTSKGGTTEAALKVLADKGVEESFLQAFEAAEKRGRELRGA
ncbi:MAG TPA: pyrroline-5-carboxylate reductase [Verrucomicrobiae bacterium]|jgi:pyrroline-5-carboxylate reductase|nr:pyrroline-5-carboxylate reductase [Verrucomicrobiae bacterium]